MPARPLIDARTLCMEMTFPTPPPLPRTPDREKEKEEQHTTHSSNETTATTTTTTTTLTSKRHQLYPTAAWTIPTSPAAKLPEENAEKQERQSQPTAAALFVGDDDDILWNADSEDNFSSSSSPSKHSISLSLLQNSQPPIELIVKPRSKVVLPCELEGNYTSLLMLAITSYRIRPASWLHGGVPVDMITIDTRTEMSGTGHRYIGDSSTAALHIDNVRLEDDGVWKCQIEDDRGRLIIGKPVKLIVLEAPRGTYLLIDGRRLDPGNQFIPVKEGSDLRLECAVEGGNPAPILAWNMQLSQATLENPEPLPDNLTIDANTSLTSTSASLKVLRGHHNATIVCVARHLTLTVPMTASILLDVQYTPEFAITRLPGFGTPIIEGMSVSLKCDVDSNPPSLPIWQRDDGAPPVEQSEDGWLNFTKISRTDKGWYKCYTRHMLGIYTSIGYYLNVRFVPEAETQAKPLNEIITSDPRKIEVRIGGDVTLDCDGGCWGRGPSMTPAGGPGRLMLSKVVYQDAGEYRCVAPDRNLQGAWRAQLPYEIKVTGRPMVHPVSQTMTTSEDLSLDVRVEFCSEPPYTKVLWLSEERVYLPGGEIRDDVRALPIENALDGSKSCYQSVLHFERVRQRSHAGEWLLLVRSPEGFAEASLTLNVTVAAGYGYGYGYSLGPVGPSLSSLLIFFTFVGLIFLNC
ncbi:hypothetical protein TKK_0018091 [Trichogramma kaykai]|uniref:Ig-like domain-containing protein n=1 Tax=Trichogramma kaykai TaxID=54128 RepID=A0ABD2VZT8_9HYME